MNLILFEPHELGVPLPRADRRAEHVLKTLKRAEGDSVDAGLVNGARGKATIVQIATASVTFIFDAETEPPPLPPVSLIVGLPRPQTARDVLRDATTLGVDAIHFVATEKAESSYRQSTLWSSDEWRRQLILGAEQAFDTRIPSVTHGETLGAVLSSVAGGAPAAKVCLDNYEASGRLADLAIDPGSRVVVAVGSERGWSGEEREQLRQAGFAFAHLGRRVLRTETAVVAALTLVHAKLGLL